MTNNPPVVMVHGMGSNFEHNWRRHGWVDLLTEAGREVIGFDLPGHGASHPLDDGESAVGRLLDLCAAHGPVDVVAFSVGSVVSLSALTRRPELFRRAALLGLADRQLDTTQENMRKGAADLDSPAMQAVTVAAERAGNDVDAVLAWAQQAEKPPSFADLSHVQLPVLLVLGREDFLGPADRLVESLPDARLALLANTPHFATTSRHEAKDVVVDFLAR